MYTGHITLEYLLIGNYLDTDIPTHQHTLDQFLFFISENLGVLACTYLDQLRIDFIH